MDKKRKMLQGQQTRKDIYLFIVRYIKEYGYSPTYDEIAEGVSISRETVKKHVKTLMESKLLATDHPNSTRTIRVTGYRFTMIKEHTCQD